MTEPDDTTTQAELGVVDEALAWGTVTASDPAERELQELALSLRAESARPSPVFEAELRKRVERGFPRKRRARALSFGTRIAKLRRPPLPVLGGVAAMLAAIAVAVSVTGGHGDREPGVSEVPRRGASGGAAMPEPGSGGERSARTPESSPPADIAPQPPGSFAPRAGRRRIERSASLTLAARAERIDGVADGIVRLADRHQGFVLRSSLSTGEHEAGKGEFELGIPADRLQAAMADLSRLAEVRARAQSGQDVTGEWSSAEQRLQAARAERRSLLRRLERAQDDAAAEAIRRRLDLNAGEIRGLRGQVRDLRARTDYARVSITLWAEEDEGGGSPDGRGGDLGGAVDDALDSVSDSVELTIRILGIVLPIGLLTGGALLATRTVRRRRREAALG